MKHLYTTSDEQEDDHSKMGEEVVINEISQKFENRYRDRRSDFRDSSQNRRDKYSQEARTNETRWQPYNNLLNSRQPRYQETNGNRYAGEPTNIDAPMNMNTQSNADQKVRTPYPDVLTNSTTATNRQVETNYTGANPVQRDSMEDSSRNQGSGTVSTNTTSRGVGQSVLDGQTTEIREQMGDVNMDHRRNIHMQHTNAETRQSQFFQDSRQNDKRPENSSEDEVSVRRVFPDDGIFTNLVKDSISAQVRD